MRLGERISKGAVLQCDGQLVRRQRRLPQPLPLKHRAPWHRAHGSLRHSGVVRGTRRRTQFACAVHEVEDCSTQRCVVRLNAGRRYDERAEHACGLELVPAGLFYGRSCHRQSVFLAYENDRLFR